MHILIVGDRETFTPNLCLMLERMGHDVTVAVGGEDALRVLRAVRAHAVIIDREGLGPEGADLHRRIRDRAEAPYPYLILLGRDLGLEDRIAAVRAGADDVLASPPDAGELMIRLEVAARFRAVMDEQERRIALLAEMAGTDELTGTRNLRKFRESLGELFSLSRRERLPFSLVVLDVDDFKGYNDAFGHLAGDEVLRRVGALIGIHVRQQDVAARVGGDEFALLLPSTGAEPAISLAERLRLSLKSYQWPLRQITVSLGVATRSAATDRPETLIDEADRALYVSKRQGRDRVTHFRDLVVARP